MYINKIFNAFHIGIIALFILIFSGCGKKGDPIYVPPKKIEKTTQNN